MMVRSGRASARMLRVAGALDAEVGPGTRVAVPAWGDPVAYDGALAQKIQPVLKSMVESGLAAVRRLHDR